MRKLVTPSPALVIAILALFLALGGTGYAANQEGSGANIAVATKASVLISIGSTSTGKPNPTDVRFGWRATS